MAATASVIGHRYLRIEEPVQGEQRAADLFSRLRGEAIMSRLRGALTGRPTRLLSLADVEASCTIVNCRDAGARTVPIDRIRGSSSNRCLDFDTDFRPLHSREQSRWLRLAAAHLRGAKLPPVDLIEVADCYFVVDGHHRISVTRALGQTEICARVTTWQVAGSLPWENR